MGGKRREDFAPSGEVREVLFARLEARRPEIEMAMLSRVYGVSDPAEVGDPEYAEGLREAVSVALDYGLSAVERGRYQAPIPRPLLAQARQAARNGVPLDIVLRRYFAGYTLLGNFIKEEAVHEAALGMDEIQRLDRDQAALFDQLVPAVTKEYEKEIAERLESVDERLAERVRRLLAGEMLDISEFGYDFSAWHLGVVAAGPDVTETIRGFASTLDRRLLLVRCGNETVWAWLGGRERVDALHLADLESPPGISLGIGEPGKGITGWRLTHRQARATFPLATRTPGRSIRYADVALLASMLQDAVLISSLRRLYLEPLSHARDGGVALRQTLRAYFAAERNTSSAAAALRVSRQTVINRLRTVEERLGQPLHSCAMEIEAALRLDDWDSPLLNG